MSVSSAVVTPPVTLLTLSIKAGDDATEIFVIDGEFKLVDQGVGQLVCRLLPGIYKIKAKVNQQTWEQHVTLTQPEQTVSIPRFRFPSAAPLADTAKTHEYHMLAARTESCVIDYAHGQGSSIFVFARDWKSNTRPQPAPSVNPVQKLSLLDANESEIVKLESCAHVDYSNPDCWGACNVAVNPGLYLLRLTLPGGACHERTIVAASGWQTQLFLFLRDYDGMHCADLLRGAVLMAPGMGFSEDEEAFRQIELARMALVNQRKLARGELYSMLLRKFANPMFGILGGHVLLIEAQPDVQLLTQVVENLRGMLGSSHPDVEALALAAGIPTAHVFSVPPMLRRSWIEIVKATVERPGLVPSGSLADRCSSRQWAVEPWLTWNTAQTGGPDEEDGGTIADFTDALKMHAFAMPSLVVTQAAGHSDSPFAAVRNMRAKRPAPVFAAAPTRTAPATRTDPAKIGNLVKTLGVPRSTVERMVQQMSSTHPSAPSAPATRTQWCFAWPAASSAVGGKEKAALVKDSRWNPGDIISISFLDGDPVLQERVKQAALTWTGPSLARLVFDFRKNTNDTLIRISFQYPGSWSVIGTTCRRITDKTRPTMNFGWLTPQSSDDEIRGVVLHEFGHALGLIHEHQSPDEQIKWNRDAVVRDLSGPPNNWTEDVIEHNMFEAYAAKETNFSKFDEKSIMIYPIPPEWTLDGFAVQANDTLSDIDRSFIRSQYP